MNNVKKNRTGVRMLGNGRKWTRFTMNKTQKNQPVYKNIEPRCPGAKGNKPGCISCPGSNTDVGCKTCWGCTYTFDVSSNAFTGAYPSYGSFANVNLLVDNSNNPPCEWQYNAIVEGFNVNAAPGASLNARVTLNIEDNKCVGDISGIYFYPPVGGAMGVYIGYYKVCNGLVPYPVVLLNELGPAIPHKFVTTAKRMGAPYRNPIAGWRRTLDCCEEPCKVLYSNAVTQQAYPSVGGLVGGRFITPDCGGTITDYSTDGATHTTGNITTITVELDYCCCVPDGNIGSFQDLPGGASVGSPQFQRERIITGETSGAAQQPTNTVYKDNYSGRKGAGEDGCGACAVDCNNTLAPRSGIQGRTHKPIIRSGMQEKRPCCMDSNGKCNKTNDYSFSYWQYKHNKRCLDYERNQEKYVRNFPACGMFHGRIQCLNAYRKSSCCDCACEPCSQLIRNGNTGVFEYAPQIGDNAVQTGTGATGIVVSFTTGTGPANDIDTVTIQATDCENLFGPQEVGTNNIVFSGPNSGGYTLSQRTMDLFTILSETKSGSTNNCSSKAMSKTIYKPSNKKFSHQGAVTSGGRLERLKLDTIKSANSRCIKGQKCITIPSKFVGLNKTYEYPNGKYDAGKPRFTGWMFNGHHSEVKGRVYNMVRYNQQPLGIPQLTAHRLTLSQGGNGCIKQCFPRTLDLGSNRSTAAGNRARIPGSKCRSNCVCILILTGDFSVTGTPLVIGATISSSSDPFSGTVISFTDASNNPSSVTVRTSGSTECILPRMISYEFSSGGTLTVQNFTISSQDCCNKCGGNTNSIIPCNNIPNQTGQGVPCC